MFPSKSDVFGQVARSNGSVSMEEELQQMRRAEVRAAAVLNGGTER